jgi:hypothetical protein
LKEGTKGGGEGSKKGRRAKEGRKEGRWRKEGCEGRQMVKEGRKVEEGRRGGCKPCFPLVHRCVFREVVCICFVHFGLVENREHEGMSGGVHFFSVGGAWCS